MIFFEKLLKTFLLSTLIISPALLVLASEEHPKTDRRHIVEKRLKELRKDLEEIRGLKFKKSVQVSYKNREEMHSYVRELMQRESMPLARGGENKALAEFGFIPEGIDLGQFLAAFYARQALGFYDIDRSELVLISDLLSDQDLSKNPDVFEANQVLKEYYGIDLVDFALFHELDHALIDQNFPLNEIRELTQNNFDRVLSYQAFIEGEAILANHIFIFEPLGLAKEIVEKKLSMDNIIDQQLSLSFVDDISSLPSYITAIALFPYQNGLDFITEIYLKGGWKAVNALYSHPPVSTEHILHPEKYIQKKDPPREIILPKMETIIGPQWKPIDRNTLGEFRISLLISNLLEKDDTSLIASEGWGGDQYILFENDKQNRILYFKSLWDSEGDAQEFYEAFIRANQHQSFAEDKSQSEGGHEKILKTNQIEIFIKISGDTVEILKGPLSQIDKIRMAFREKHKSKQNTKEGPIQQDLN